MAQSQRTSGGTGGTDGWFGPLDLLRSALSSLFATSGAETDGVEEERSSDAEGTDGVEAADSEPASIDFAAMEPESALYALLCREDGKIKQSAMVTETGWSKSKVSRRLSNLEEAGRIGRVRQGREKVVFVKPGSPDEDADADANAGVETPA